MREKQQTIEYENKLELTPIKGTPFSYATNEEKNYLTCGKVILEIEKTYEECKEWVNEKPWEAMALLTQAVLTELLNDK